MTTRRHGVGGNKTQRKAELLEELEAAGGGVTLESALQAAIAALTDVMRTCRDYGDISTAAKHRTCGYFERQLARLQQRHRCAPKQ